MVKVSIALMFPSYYLQKNHLSYLRKLILPKLCGNFFPQNEETKFRKNVVKKLPFCQTLLPKR